MRVAIIGSGIAGLGCAWLLRQQGCEVSLFEANDYLGGHTHTVDVLLDGIKAPVDTGFLVYNDRTYPKLIALFNELGITSAPSTMSFSVRNDSADIEWAGTGIGSLFAQPGNALRPKFWRMLKDLLRFNREATEMHLEDRVYDVTVGEFLEAGDYSTPFRDWYLLPMAASIWSVPEREALDFPLLTFVRFCHDHGLLQISGRPQWRTVVGGARTYVDRIAADLSDIRLSTPVRRVRRRRDSVEVSTDSIHGERFDQVVLACHSEQALTLLADASDEERHLLQSIRYQANRVLLHTDTRLMPKRRRAWAAWNYLAPADVAVGKPVAVSYWLNRLQPLPFQTPLMVTLNPPLEPRPETQIAEFEYSHPMVKGVAETAQQRLAHLQGEQRTWYAGAWMGHGFHEDGVVSAHIVAEGVAMRLATIMSEREAA
ncbi:MAG: FAD-dependent oxidoreductase [Betaproteobacteria bacterium]|nr:MAG: FAD-dependent oxidoreductase [Betaproteobacteria bacterium]